MVGIFHGLYESARGCPVGVSHSGPVMPDMGAEAAHRDFGTMFDGIKTNKMRYYKEVDSLETTYILKFKWPV